MKQTALVLYTEYPKHGEINNRLNFLTDSHFTLSSDDIFLFHKLVVKSLVEQFKADQSFYDFFVCAMKTKDEMTTHYQDIKTIVDRGNGEIDLSMALSFQTLKKIGYKHILFVLGDCIETTIADAKDADNLLDETDVVVGPSDDGFVYLLGLKSFPDAVKGVNFVKNDSYMTLMRQIRYAGLNYKTISEKGTLNSTDDIIKMQTKILNRQISMGKDLSEFILKIN